MDNLRGMGYGEEWRIKVLKNTLIDNNILRRVDREGDANRTTIK